MTFIKSYNNINSIINKIPSETEVLLLGESTHGTEEFYQIRSDITKHLVENNDYNIILFETDWFNLYNVNKYINNNSESDDVFEALININNFPKWLWKNNVIIELMQWLRMYNLLTKKKIYILGLDCYLLIESLAWLHIFFKLFDNELFEKLKKDLHFMSNFKKTEHFINAIMKKELSIDDIYFENYFQDLLVKIQNNSEHYTKLCEDKGIDNIAVISAEVCCDVIINSFEYFKKQYLEPHGSNASWNTRDQHMLMTTMKLKDNIKDAKIIVWAHNSHIGDATASERGGTDFSNNNTWNLGQMCRAMFANTYIIGMGTYQGTVKASPSWGEKESVYILNLPIDESIEAFIHKQCQLLNIKNCYLELSKCNDKFPYCNYVKQRMIGVIYCPNTELQSHYITYNISKQFDLYIFITQTTALEKITPKKKFSESF
jgi:erythromycin esterase-like protein